MATQKCITVHIEIIAPGSTFYIGRSDCHFTSWRKCNNMNSRSTYTAKGIIIIDPKEVGWREWNRLIWLRIGTGGGYKRSDSVKCGEIKTT
jgi:hypothetical protein